MRPGSALPGMEVWRATMLNIAVLVASYNRVAVTLAGLTSLFEAAASQDQARIALFLVDDASPDGTARQVLDHFPDAHVTLGNGRLWWNRAMCAAYRAARAFPTDFDAYLLFNDDVVLDRGALAETITAFVTLNRLRPTALTGAMRSPADGRPVFEGLRREPAHRPFPRPFRPPFFSRLAPDGTVREVDSFFGNFVLVPAAAMHAVGGLDPRFLHRYGDTDLGLRLGEQGCRLCLLPATVGCCEPKPRIKARGFVGRIRQNLVPPDNIGDDVRWAFRRYPVPLAIGNAAIRLAYLVWNALHPPLRPRQRPAPALQDDSRAASAAAKVAGSTEKS